ncbi:hypothetical protein Tco_0672461 [Tanacetum coccineum]
MSQLLHCSKNHFSYANSQAQQRAILTKNFESVRSGPGDIYQSQPTRLCGISSFEIRDSSFKNSDHYETIRKRKVGHFGGTLVLDKTTEFLKKIQGKDSQKMLQLQNLGSETELRAREKELFIEKLKDAIPF